jgi:hypothetical protein
MICAAVQVDGNMTVDDAPNGFFCRIEAPLAAIAGAEAA